MSLLVKKPLNFITATSVKYNLQKKKTTGRGKGKTHGRGSKGYHARRRRATPTPGFEGGQSGIIKALPKIGLQSTSLQSIQKPVFTPLHLDTLKYLIDTKQLANPITLPSLVRLGCMGKIKHGIVLLARGAQFFNHKVDIQVSKASFAAIDAIEKAGGKISCVYHSKESIDSFRNPDKYMNASESGDFEIPLSKHEISRYIDKNRRGYLSQEAEKVERKELMRKLLDLVLEKNETRAEKV